jgi:hypothetical protein
MTGLAGLRFGAGVSLEQLILRHALSLGLDDLARESTASGWMMLPIPGAGTRGRGAGAGARGGGHRRAGDHDRPRPPGGAASRRRPLPGVPVRALAWVRVLLISTYEFGHQPLQVASPVRSRRAGS